jgi:hypothetical protein
LIAILVLIVAAGESGTRLAARLRTRMIRHAPILLPLLVGGLGVALIVAAFV